MAFVKRSTYLIALLAIIFSADYAATADAANDPTFKSFLDQADKAQLEFQQGNPESYKALWSHESDVKLAGGFGGSFEQGWDRVSKRLDWASSQFREGRNEIQRLAFGTGGDLGYLIQTEHLVFKNPEGKPVERKYRVTMLFRREDGNWRIIHRHADTQNEKAAPR